MKLVPTRLMRGITKALQETPDDADVLLRLGLFEALTDLIEPVRQPMTYAVVKNMAEITAAARTAALRSSVSKQLGEDELAYIDALSIADEWVEKGIASDILDMLREKAERQPRDKGGRFVRGSIGSRTNQDLPLNRKLPSHMTEAIDLRDRWLKAGIISPETTLTLRTAPIQPDGSTAGGVQDEQVKASELEHALAAGVSSLPVELAVARRDVNRMTPQQMAAIDLTQLATQQSYGRSKQMTSGLFDNGKVRDQGSNAESWYGQTNGTDRQSYRRIKMTGQALSSVSTPGSAAQFAGGVAQLVGDLGPEAEKILGPGIRRTAYRYRGTERRPDRHLYTAVERASQYADGLNKGPAGRQVALSDMAAAVSAKGEKDPAALIASNYTREGLPSDHRDLRTRGDTAVAAMLGVGTGGGRERSALPDLEITQLSLKSGEVPPSEGVIIDAHGHVVSQAVGYNGDHYLPFDLRNLNSLYGGQYVRTRASGGPTTEDIYTALVTGARQIQVVSNSGVFTVEFDPDLRGARRFNDKVKRMTQRYGEMLETIHEGGHNLYENDLPPEKKLELRQRAIQASRTQSEFESTLRDLEANARLKGSVSDVSPDELEEAAYNHATHVVDQEMAQGNALSSQGRARRIEEEAKAYISRQDPAVRELQLNGEGYNRALKALKQEFPYYIRSATFEPLPQFLGDRGLPTLGYKRNAPKDKAFVERGQTNTLSSRTGAARSARYVPTGRKAADAETDAAPKVAERKEQSGAASVATIRATGSDAPKKLDLVKMTGPDGELTRRLGVQLSVAASIAESVTPQIRAGAGATDEDWMALGPYPYAHHVMTDFVNKSPEGMGGQKMATWLMTEATPQQRNLVLHGLEEMAGEREGWTGLSAPEPSEIRKLHRTVQGLVDLSQPFAAVPEGVEPWAIAPSSSMKPAHFDAVPALDASAEDWDHVRSRLDLDDYQSSALADIESAKPMERMALVQDVYNEYKADQNAASEANLKNMQLAWSFIHARDVSAKLHELAGSDAGPKVPAAADPIGKSQSPSRLDAFLLELQQEVAALLER